MFEMKNFHKKQTYANVCYKILLLHGLKAKAFGNFNI